VGVSVGVGVGDTALVALGAPVGLGGGVMLAGSVGAAVSVAATCVARTFGGGY
jgi:hypothetical protein